MKPCALVLSLLLVASSASAQQSPTPLELVDQIQVLLDQLKVALAPPLPQPTIIRTAEELDAALASDVPGQTLVLASSLVYPSLLTLRAPVTLRAEGFPDSVAAVRVDMATPLPQFNAGLIVSGNDVTLIGLQVKHTDPLTDITRISGARVTFDRLRILGDTVKGAKRGIAANGNGDVKILRSYVEDCFQASPGNDSQALIAWDMAPGLLIENNYLSGGSETLMFGGADSSSDERTPADIVVRHNTITKRVEWFGKPIGVKNLVEFKNAKRVLFEDNDCIYSWAQGQTGYLLVLTVRNQDGRAPWSTIQDVTFKGNRWSRGASAITILGRDDIKETGAGKDVPVGTVRRSMPMARVSIIGDTFTELDPAKWAAGITNKAVQIGNGPLSLTIDSVTFASVSSYSSAVYFTALPQAEAMVFTNNTMPPSAYGMFGANSTVAKTNWTSTSPTWVRYVSNGAISGITAP